MTLIQALKKMIGGIGTKAMEVQSVLCSKEKFASAEDAAKWCNAHDFCSEKVDTTNDYYRFRQFDPGRCQEGSFRTTTITDGVKAVVCRIADENAMESNMIHVSIPFEVKSDSGGVYVEGYASREIWDNQQDYIPAETAFKALSTYFKAGTKLCLLHIFRLDAGKVENIEVVEDGFRIKARPKDSVIPLIKDGTLNGFSIGFRPIKWEMLPEGRKILDWNLYEISLVDIPANPGCYFDFGREGKMLPKGTKVVYDTTSKAVIVSGLDDTAMGEITEYLSQTIGGLSADLEGHKSEISEVDSLIFKRGNNDGLDNSAPKEQGEKKMSEKVTEGNMATAKPSPEPTPATDGKAAHETQPPVTIDAVKSALATERKAQEAFNSTVDKRLGLIEKALAELMETIADLPRPSTSVPVNGIRDETKTNKSPFAGMFGNR